MTKTVQTHGAIPTSDLYIHMNQKKEHNFYQSIHTWAYQIPNHDCHTYKLIALQVYAPVIMFEMISKYTAPT